jgi:hypothetical protein
MAEPANVGTFRFIAEKGLGLLTVIVALSYAVIRPTYEQFYAPLGLTPEDVGLTQVGMISRGASIFVWSFAATALPFLISIVIYLSVKGRGVTSQAAILASLLALSGSILLFSVLFSRSGGWGIFDPTLPISLITWVFLGCIATLGALLYQKKVRNPLSLRDLVFPHAQSSGPRVLLVATMVLVLLAFGFTAWFSAEEAGQRYLETGRLDESAIVGFLNIRNTKVTITPISGDIRQICDLFDDARLIGRSGDASYTLFLSTREPSQVVRVPDDEYKVTPTQGALPCQNPQSEQRLRERGIHHKTASSKRRSSH